MKFNVIDMFDERLNKLYDEVLRWLINDVRDGMDQQAQAEGMKGFFLYDEEKFRFFNKDGFWFTHMMQSSFMFRQRLYNVNIVLVYKGEYYIPEMTLNVQHQQCWDYVFTPCLLPIYVETDDTIGQNTVDIPTFSGTMDRRKTGYFREGDGLGETIRIQAPQQIYPALFVNPLSFDPSLECVKEFEADIVRPDFRKPLEKLELAAINLENAEEAIKGIAHCHLATHAYERPNPNIDFVLQHYETAAAVYSPEMEPEVANFLVTAPWVLVRLYYYGEAGVEINYEKAVRYIKMLAASPINSREYYDVLLGECYWRGKGVERDINKAITIFSNCEEMSTAYHNLSYIYATGDGVDVDPAQAKEYYDIAKQKGLHEEMLKCKASLIENPVPAMVKAQNDNVRKLAKVARILADYGDKEARKDLEEVIPTLYMPED